MWSLWSWDSKPEGWMKVWRRLLISTFTYANKEIFKTMTFKIQMPFITSGAKFFTKLCGLTSIGLWARWIVVVCWGRTPSTWSLGYRGLVGSWAALPDARRSQSGQSHRYSSRLETASLHTLVSPTYTPLKHKVRLDAHEVNCNIPSLMKLNFSTNLHYYRSVLLIKLALHTHTGWKNSNSTTQKALFTQFQNSLDVPYALHA